MVTLSNDRSSPDELVGADRHCAVPRLPVAAVVLVAEGYAALVESNEATVGDGDMMGGPLPREVENLLEITAIKRACREAGVEKLEAGPKGAVVSLRENRFARPAGLVDLIQRNAGTLKLRPDQKIVYLLNWDDERTRLAGVAKLL